MCDNFKRIQEAHLFEFKLVYKCQHLTLNACITGVQRGEGWAALGLFKFLARVQSPIKCPERLFAPPPLTIELLGAKFQEKDKESWSDCFFLMKYKK